MHIHESVNIIISIMYAYDIGSKCQQLPLRRYYQYMDECICTCCH